jgi:putative Ca2+/H+ antiporter (TMEM165/GDT1 family)
MNFEIAAIVFGVVFISELPDKSMFASLILSTRYPRLFVWAGAAAAFLVHVVIAVVAGGFLSLLPKTILDFVVAGLFFLGALLIIISKKGDKEAESKVKKTKLAKNNNFWKVAPTAFGLIFICEWGDITQIVTANYAASYHDPLSVGVGAVLALWLVAAVAVLAGPKIMQHVPAKLLTTIAAAILIAFGSFSLVSALS